MSSWNNFSKTTNVQSLCVLQLTLAIKTHFQVFSAESLYLSFQWDDHLLVLPGIGVGLDVKGVLRANLYVGDHHVGDHLLNSLGVSNRKGIHRAMKYNPG